MNRLMVFLNQTDWRRKTCVPLSIIFPAFRRRFQVVGAVPIEGRWANRTISSVQLGEMHWSGLIEEPAFLAR
jgi:hypothetical protein